MVGVIVVSVRFVRRVTGLLDFRRVVQLFGVLLLIHEIVLVLQSVFSLVLFADLEALMEHINLASVDEVQVVAVLVLPNDDVLRHEKDRLQVVHNETLLDGGAVLQLDHVVNEVLVLVEQYFVFQRW